MPNKSNPVITMLKADHKKVKSLFAEYGKAETQRQHTIAQTVIDELEVHAELEEDLIYPVIRDGIEEDDLMNEAKEEHHLVHVLIAELKRLTPSDESFKAKFIVLGEVVKHHVKEEEGEIFPKAQRSKIDWKDLYARVVPRKARLMKAA
jgi:hemerythrin superfamily protein